MNWRRLGLMGLLMMLLFLIACQPQVVEVEVTRLVSQAAVVETAVPPPSTEPETIEVTRLVTQEVTRIVPSEVIIEVTKAPLGSEERPVQLLFAPTVSTAVIHNRVQPLVDALTTATGYRFEIGILDDEPSVVALMCSAPQDTIAVLSAMGYVLAHERCGVQAANVSVQPNGLTWQTGMIVTRRDSGINALADLAGKRWAVPDAQSVANTLYFQALLSDMGIEPGEMVVLPGDNTAMLAVYNGDVDFATGTFVPPILPFAEREWIYGEDDPEPWRRLGLSPTRSGIGFIVVNGRPENGGYRVRDARSGVFDTTPGIFDETQILALSAPIPNETVAFGADFPIGLARQIIPVLTEFAASDVCRTSLCAADFYGWTGLVPAVAEDYEPLRFVKDTLSLTGEEIWGIGD